MWGYQILSHEESAQTEPLGPLLCIAGGRDNFGEVWEDSEFVWVAPIENRGTVEVTITDFDSSCSCSKIEPRQLTIFQAFQEQRWKRVLDDPLPPVPGKDPKQRLHQAINNLKRGQKLLNFVGRGNGQQIGWEPR